MAKLIIWLLAAGKMGKLLTTGGTMLISMLVYSWVYGWRYAVGFVLLILCHEMGHYVAARHRRRRADLHSLRRCLDRAAGLAARR